MKQKVEKLSNVSGLKGFCKEERDNIPHLIADIRWIYPVYCCVAIKFEKKGEGVFCSVDKAYKSVADRSCCQWRCTRTAGGTDPETPSPRWTP